VIAALRRRHRVTVCSLAVILPVIVVAGLALRSAPPTMDQLPELDRFVPGFPIELPSVSDSALSLWNELPHVGVPVFADRNPPTRLAVRMFVKESLDKPELLLYWSREAIPPSNGPANNAHFLGVLKRGKSLHPLPVEALAHNGHLTLYSLATHEVIATAILSTARPHAKEAGKP